MLLKRFFKDPESSRWNFHACVRAREREMRGEREEKEREREKSIGYMLYIHTYAE